MPELPEVETIRRQLHDRLAGRTILEVVLLRSGREKPVGKKFVASLRSKRIAAIERRAKLLIWRFVDDSAMVAHLKMTGKFLFVPKGYETQKHDRLVLTFKDARVVWSDVRMFGYLRVISADDLTTILEAYGPEPLVTSAADLAERLRTPATRTIKAALLDQATIAGIGNIYADEACHRAGIRPTRRLRSLTSDDRLQLAKEIKKVLQTSVDRQGTSSDDYRDANGEPGKFQNLLRVYGRGGKPCKTCTTPIKKTVLAGRGTHYCPECQK